MKVTVKHSCNHSREVQVKGVKEARQYSKWLGAQVCPDCKEKQSSK